MADHEAIRKALAAGPTPGPWTAEPVPSGHRFGGSTHQVIALVEDGSDTRSLAFTGGEESRANAELIAACNPQAITALLADYDRLAAEVEARWRPIETAPKDNKARLVWCPVDKNIFTASWYEDDWMFFGGSGYLREPPTHWMPLPPPPSAESAIRESAPDLESLETGEGDAR